MLHNIAANRHKSRDEYLYDPSPPSSSFEEAPGNDLLEDDLIGDEDDESSEMSETSEEGRMEREQEQKAIERKLEMMQATSRQVVANASANELVGIAVHDAVRETSGWSIAEQNSQTSQQHHKFVPPPISHTLSGEIESDETGYGEEDAEEEEEETVAVEDLVQVLQNMCAKSRPQDAPESADLVAEPDSESELRAKKMNMGWRTADSSNVETYEWGQSQRVWRMPPSDPPSEHDAEHDSDPNIEPNLSCSSSSESKLNYNKEDGRGREEEKHEGEFGGDSDGSDGSHGSDRSGQTGVRVRHPNKSRSMISGRDVDEKSAEKSIYWNKEWIARKRHSLDSDMCTSSSTTHAISRDEGEHEETHNAANGTTIDTAIGAGGNGKEPLIMISVPNRFAFIVNVPEGTQTLYMCMFTLLALLALLAMNSCSCNFGHMRHVGGKLGGFGANAIKGAIECISNATLGAGEHVGEMMHDLRQLFHCSLDPTSDVCDSIEFTPPS